MTKEPCGKALALRPLAIFLLTCWLASVLFPVALVQAAEPDSAEADKPKPDQAAIPEELASPRATLNAFLLYMGQVAKNTDDNEAWRLAFQTLDTPESTGDARKEMLIKLLGVFNGLGHIQPQHMAPGENEVKEQKLTRFEFLPGNTYKEAQQLINKAISDLGSQPPGKIVLARTETGAWKFNSETLNAIGPLWSWMEKHGVQYGVDIIELSSSERLRRELIPDSLKGYFILGVELWQWVALLAALLLAVITDYMSRLLLRPVARRIMGHTIGDIDPADVRYVVRPIGLLISAAVFWLLLGLLDLTGIALIVLVSATKVVMAFSGAWVAWAIVETTGNAVERKLKAAGETGIREMVVPLLRKTAKLFIVAFALIYAAASLDINIVPLLGSVGLAGLAISFAAQDLIRNLFGGMTVFLDQPFKLGDRILYQGYDGTIEYVGIRSTKIRTLSGHLVTIPNGGVTSEPVENVTSRPFIKRVMDVTITYDTSREMIERAVRIIQDILEEDELREPIHPRINGDEYPPRVYFTAFNADSLNIMVIYWYVPPAYWDYLEHGQRVNLRIFEEFEKAGIEFAFPTRTLYLAGDPKRELAVRMLGRDLEAQT